MKSCCCCLNLKQGSIASGIWTIVVGSVIVALNGVALGLLYAIYDDPGNSRDALTFYASWVDVGVFGCWVLAAILLIIGVAKGIRGLFWPWMISGGIILVIIGLIVGFYCTVIGIVFSNPLTSAQFIINATFLIIGIYAMVCVSAHYRELGIIPLVFNSPIQSVEFQVQQRYPEKGVI